MENILVVQGQKVYNAIEVYEKLRNGREKYTPYHKWISSQVVNWGFKEHKDFWKILSKSTGGRPATDWYITLTTAIQLCMIDKSEIGMQVRNYYVEIDDKYRKQLHRDSSKLTRRGLTDFIVDSGENERMHGHGFSTYTKLIYKKLGIEYAKQKNFRDTLLPDQLKAVETLEHLAEGYLRLGYDYSQIKNALPEFIVKKQIEIEGILND